MLASEKVCLILGGKGMLEGVGPDFGHFWGIERESGRRIPDPQDKRESAYVSLSKRGL